jgi:DtxR family Mn-dependent transcriptional regulator
MLTPTVEDYLKAIYEIQLEDPQGRAGTSALAERLGVRQASVTGMLQKLAGGGRALVEYERYQGARLTPAGERAALEVIRHHRLLEAYLNRTLGYGWDEVHQEADRLEHAISEELEERIAEFLGHPEIDPHGDPIPARDGSLKPREETRLVDMELGHPGRISRVANQDPALLRYLDELGLRLDAAVEVLDKAPFEGPVHVRLTGREAAHALSRALAERIFVTLETGMVSREGE